MNEININLGKNKRSLNNDDGDCDNRKEFENNGDNIGMEKMNNNNQNHSSVEKRTKLDCHDDDDDDDDNNKL